MRFEFAANGVAVQPWQHQVENHDIGRMGVELAQRLEATTGLEHLELCEGQSNPKQSTKLVVILDQEHSAGAHSDTLPEFHSSGTNFFRPSCSIFAAPAATAR